MGSLTEKIKELTGQKGDEQAAKSTLQVLEHLAQAKMDSYESKINMQFVNQAETEKIEIPGIRARNFFRSSHIATKEGFSEKVGDHINKVIDSLFSIGGEDQDTKSAVKDGVKSLILTALDSFIGSTEAGESEEKIYFVIPEGDVFTRVDLMVWKYHMESQKIIDRSDTAVAYVFCKSTVDHKKLKIDELIYLVSDVLTKRVPRFQEREVTTSDTPPKKVIKRYRLDANGKLIIRNQNQNLPEDNPDKYEEWLLDGQNHPGGNPPSIDEVSKYIKELSELWNLLEDSSDE